MVVSGDVSPVTGLVTLAGPKPIPLLPKRVFGSKNTGDPLIPPSDLVSTKYLVGGGENPRINGGGHRLVVWPRG
jgi:hypothetical protein